MGRGSKLFGIAFGVVGLFLTSVAVGGVASAQEPLPVPNAFLDGVVPEFQNPGGSPPGANDFSCRPSEKHPDPVILVHGTGGNRQTNWAVYAPLLANEGYCVFALTYGNFADQPWPISGVGGMTHVEPSTARLAGFVDEVLAATGATKVDLVGHSQGTVVANDYAKRYDSTKVGKIVSIAPPWNGTYGVEQFSLGAALRGAGLEEQFAAGFPVCKACTEMMHGSSFIADLRDGGLYVPGIEYTNIVTRYDEVVVPYTSGIEPGPNATNIVVQDGCEQDYSDHISIAGSLRAATFVLNALDPAHPREVPCRFVAPIGG